MKHKASALAVLALLAAACPAIAAEPLYFGADLSYVNEMEDCGAKYRVHGQVQDPFAIFKDAGANLVRVRIWNDPDWTRYSTFPDVEKTIRRARAQGLQVLLDFHYADDWADGDKQPTPKAWKDIKDTGALAKALHDFTYDTLMTLDRDGLMPELVQVGNETNPELLGGVKDRPIDWARNAALLNAGIDAVREAGAKSSIKPRVMLHIAQPENVEPWFAAATAAGVVDYDIIGISYYRKWSNRSMAELGQVIDRVHARYGKQVVVAETAYPFTTDWADSMPNLLGQDSLIDGYPATPQGQKTYLDDLSRLVLSSHGSGVIYWEPAWVSTSCKTRWGQGSGWENATFFDFRHKNELLPAASFFKDAFASVH